MFCSEVSVERFAYLYACPHSPCQVEHPLSSGKETK